MLLVLQAFVLAQTRTITGQVKDEKGSPVSFASVKVKGTNSGTSADAQGVFSISAKTGDVLVISAVDFAEKQVTVGTSESVSVSLAKSDRMIDEVVVTAQGIRRKPKELGYSLAKVSNEDLTIGRSPQLASSLSGKVSGLAIYNVNNSVDPDVKIVLRGYRSLTGNNDALIVIDGIPNTSQSVLSLLNPNDIENVTVLKGGQAATLYGSAGVNGVLVITTKKGHQGKMKVTYSNTTNFDKLAWLPEFQDKYGNGSHYATSYGAAGYKTDYKERMKDNWRPFENQQYGDPYDGSMRIVGRVLEDGSKLIIPYAAIPGERKRTFETGYTINNQIGISGGDAVGTYYLSYENNHTKGIVPGDKATRNSLRLAASRGNDRFRASFNGAYVGSAYDRTSSDFYFDVLNVAAHIPISTMRDWRTDKFANPNGFYDDYYNNPYFNADINRQRYQDANLTGNVELNLRALSWLNVVNRTGVINNSRTRKNTTEKFLYSDWADDSAYVPSPWDWANDYDGIGRAGVDILGSVFDQITNENVINNEFQLQLDKTFGDFTNNMILGQSLYQRKTKYTSVGSGSIVVPDIYNVSNRQGELTSGSGEQNTMERKYGYYADLTTGWKDKVFVHGSLRYDASSRFYKPDRDKSLYAYPYYGVDVSAVLTDLVPSIKSNILNYAKLRAGYNKNGNDNIGLYGLDLNFSNGSGFPYGNTVGITVGDVLPDAGLRPEFVKSFEVGGEFQLWRNRINLDASFYRQKSDGQLLTVKIPNSTGYPFLSINVGETKNWGYETDLRVQVLNSTALNLEMSFRYSYNNNEVLNLFQGVDQFAYGGYSYAQTYVIKGESYPRMKATGYQRDSLGRVMVDRNTGYPLRPSDLQNFGRTTPPHMAGTGMKVRYGNFLLMANAEYRGGHVIFHQLGRDMTFTGSGKWTENREPHIFPNSSYIDASGKLVENTSVYVREAEYALWVDNYRHIAENFITPGWFIKLRDVNLSYTIPVKYLARTKVITGASVAIFGRNLLTAVDKTNMYTDPEFSYTTGNGQGINNTGQTPPVRQYGFNINLSF